MDPFSLSLLSLGVSSMAIRRLSRVALEREAAANADAEANAPPLVRQLVIHAVAELSLRKGRGQDVRIAEVAKDLAINADYPGLVVDTDVALDTVFELEGDGIDDVCSILSRRRIDAVIYDSEGVAQCALHQSRGPSDPPPLLVTLFKASGLPLITLPVHPDWREAMVRVDEVLGVGREILTDRPAPAARSKEVVAA